MPFTFHVFSHMASIKATSSRSARHQHSALTHGMDLTQILLFALLLVPAWMRCFEDHELRDAAHRKLQHFPQFPDPPAHPAHSPASCPLTQFTQQPQLPQDVQSRSLSPWRYETVKNEDFFPHSYSEARCLCSGCVLVQDKRPPVESHDYNSVPIFQNRVFLKKELCEDGRRHSLRPVNVKVAVGCTCARPNTSS